MKKTVVVTMLAIISGGSFAGYVPVLDSRAISGTISYNGLSASSTEGVSGRMAAFGAKVYSLPGKLKGALDPWIQQLASTQGASFVSSKAAGSFNGSIAGLTGGLAGYNRLTLSGPSYSATISKSGSSHGIGYTCAVTLSANNVAATVVYEPVYGTVHPDSSLTTLHLNPGSNVSCSTSLDWIPVIGGMVTDYMEQKITETTIGKINEFSADFLKEIIPAAPSYLGIYDAISAPAYSPAKFGGFDAAGYIKNNFATLFTGRSLSFSLGGLVTPVVPASWDRKVPTQNTFVSTPLTIDFSDANTTLKFSIQDVSVYEWVWACDPRKGDCMDS